MEHLIETANEIFGTVKAKDSHRRRSKVTSFKYVFHHLNKVEKMRQKEIARIFNRDASTVNRAIKKVSHNPLTEIMKNN